MDDRSSEDRSPAPERPEAGRATDVDFYLTPDGFLVFTEAYHLKRGYCCGNRCRHCPYGHRAAKD